MRDWRDLLERKGLLDWLIGVGLFAASSLIYLHTLAPSAATVFDDSLEFQLVCYQLGIAHPTGYPLYTLLGKLFTFLPVGDVAYRVNLMSAFFASLTVAILYPTLKTLTNKRAPAILGAATFAVSPVFWSQAVIAEVYTLNTVFVALTVCLLLAWARAREQPQPSSRGILTEPTTLLYIAALVYGLSLTHHRTMLLLAPAAILFVFLVDRRLLTDRRRPIKLAVLLLAPLSLYLYIPLRGITMSSLDGFYQNTVRGFITHVTASSYGIFLTENPMQQSRSPAFYLTLLRTQFTWPGLVVGALGLAWSFRKPKAALLLAISAVTIAVFGVGYRVPDIQVFFIPLFLLCAVWVGAGFAALWEVFTSLLDRLDPAYSHRVRTALYLLLLAGGALLPLYLWRTNSTAIDLSRNWEVHDYGVDMLNQPLEEDAVIVGILGEMTLLNYFQQTEGLRPELATIAADREDQRLAVVSAQMEANHPVYLTRPLPGVQEEYHLSSLGPLIHVRQRATTIASTANHRLSVPFGEAILLRGYDAHLRDTHLDQSLRLTLYWQPLAEIGEDYKVSVRLLDDDGHLGGVHDAFPVRDAYRTLAWRPGETIIDTHDLPLLAGLPPGEYTMQVTLYRPQTLEPVGSAAVGTVSVARTIGLEGAGPWDVQQEVKANLGGRLTLLGYSVIGRDFRPGDMVPLTFLWQGLSGLDDDYSLLLWLDDEAGVQWAKTEAPLGGDYPPSAWDHRQIVRDWQQLLVPGNTVDGRYRLKMQVLADGSALRRRYWLFPMGSVLDLGEINVKGRERSFAIPPIEHRLDLRLDKTVMLLGYDLEPAEVRPGDDLHLTLYWQGLGPMDTSYTVFVHLIDEEGNIRAQQDSAPGEGALPTTSWAEGEVIADRYQIPVPSDAPPGAYGIAVGMYDAATGERLAVFDGDGHMLGDHLDLSGILVSGE